MQKVECCQCCLQCQALEGTLEKDAVQLQQVQHDSNYDKRNHLLHHPRIVFINQVKLVYLCVETKKEEGTMNP